MNTVGLLDAWDSLSDAASEHGVYPEPEWETAARAVLVELIDAAREARAAMNLSVQLGRVGVGLAPAADRLQAAVAATDAPPSPPRPQRQTVEISIDNATYARLVRALNSPTTPGDPDAS